MLSIKTKWMKKPLVVNMFYLKRLDGEYAKDDNEISSREVEPAAHVVH